MSIRMRCVGASETNQRDPAGTFPACEGAKIRVVCTIIQERVQDEKLSRRGGSDPRGISQTQGRLHYVLAGVGMVAGLGGAGTAAAREPSGPDLPRVVA